MADIIDIAEFKAEQENQPLKPGEIRWHGSDPECPTPDIGIELQLDAKKYLWVGEISRNDWEEHNPESEELGNDCGWWIAIYEGGNNCQLIGKVLDHEAADILVKTIQAAITGGMLHV